jgi:Protein of unknown function (DUF2973)
MLQILYIVAFMVVAFLAVSNLIRSILTLGLESTRPIENQGRPGQFNRRSGGQSVPHPELLDANGRIIDEPLMVMKSMTVEDARERLDAIYRSSPGGESNNSAGNDDE